MKIVIDEDIPYIKQVFEPYAEVVYRSGSGFTKQDVQDADALIVRTRTPCNEALLAGSSVRCIATATIGYDHIDTSWCAEQGIQWSNAAGCNAAAVGQYVVCALLHIAHKYNLELAGKTLGIVGLGHVGSIVQSFAHALDIKVLCCDPPRVDAEGLTGFLDLYDLAAQADFVSFHVPLTQTLPYPTYQLASKRFFSCLKQGSVFINSSRGEVVDEAALQAAIKEKKIRACVLDVWNKEPDINIELMKMVDLASPHIAGYSAQGKANATGMSVQYIAKALDLPLTSWQVDLAPPTPSTIVVDGSGRNMQQIIHAAMEQTYSITNDDSKLRTSPASFELLRKNYYYRHQPDSYTLQVSKLPSGGRELLRLLGFKLG